MKTNISLLDALKTILGLCFTGIGLINLFWGNDPFYGLFVIILALAFFVPFRKTVKRWTGIVLPGWLLILIALFIVWSSVGVGELFDKIDMMINTFKSA